MTAQMTEPKFCTHQAVHGVKYGSFVVMGRRWSDVVGEWIYGVVQLNEAGEPVSREMNMVESMLQAA